MAGRRTRAATRREPPPGLRVTALESFPGDREAVGARRHRASATPRRVLPFATDGAERLEADAELVAHLPSDRTFLVGSERPVDEAQVRQEARVRLAPEGTRRGRLRDPERARSSCARTKRQRKCSSRSRMSPSVTTNGSISAAARAASRAPAPRRRRAPVSTSGGGGRWRTRSASPEARYARRGAHRPALPPSATARGPEHGPLPRKSLYHAPSHESLRAENGQIRSRIATRMPKSPEEHAGESPASDVPSDVVTH